MNKKYIVVMVVIAIIATLGLVLPVGKSGQTIVEKLGAVSGPDLYSPYFNIDGVKTWYKRTATVSATTTPCAIQSPAATSTLLMGSFKVASTSASASYVELGRDTTRYATTTSLGKAALSANAQGTYVSSRTAAGGVDTAEVFPPNTWFVAKVVGTQLGGFCQAVFQEI